MKFSVEVLKGELKSGTTLFLISNFLCFVFQTNKKEPINPPKMNNLNKHWKIRYAVKIALATRI